MANRSSRDPGQLGRFDMTGQISPDVPSYAVNTGQAAEALANVAGSMANRLGKLADDAAKREGYLSELSKQQADWETYRQAKTAETGAASRAVGEVRAPGELRKIVSDAAVKYGVDPGALLKIAMIESSFNPKAKNPKSSAGGLFQFIDSTAASYGLADRFDPVQASDAAARLARDNAGHLKKVLGRDPTAGELYLAHQQGAGGASKLLSNPNARAADIVGAKAVTLNGGSGDMTAGQFANLWVSKVGGGGATRPGPGGQYSVEPLSTAPLALRRDGTIRGDAADEAAIQSWGWRMQQGLSTELFEAQQEFESDPAGFAAAAGKIRDKYGADLPADPVAREIFDKSFSQNTEAYSRNIAANHEKALRQEQLASYAGGLSAKQIDLERQAQVLGANPDGDRIIGEQVRSLQTSIDGAKDQGILTPDQALKAKTDIAETAARGRIQGVFDAMPTPEQKEQVAIGVLDDWKGGKGPLAQLPYETVKSISNVLLNDARALKDRASTESKAEVFRVSSLVKDDVASMAETGQGLNLDDHSLTVDGVKAALGETRFAEWQASREKASAIFRATSGMEGKSEAEIADWLARLEPQAGQEGFAEAQDVYDAALKKAKIILDARDKDPLGQAGAAGLIDLQPIDTTTPETISQSLVDRAKQAELVSGVYGVNAPIFTPQETKTLKAQMLSMDPAQQTAAMTQMDYLANREGPLAVKQQFGDDALTKLQDWQGRLRYMTPEDMTAWLKEKADPRWQERVRPLVTKGETEARKVPFDDVVSSLDDNSIFSADSPPDPETRRAMMNDYVTLVGDRYASTEDLSTAKDQAIERMRKTWGTTTAFGGSGGRLMLFPPEEHYPVVANSHAYIAAEVADLAKTNGIEPGNLSLVSDSKTEAAVDRGEAPGYLLSRTDPATGHDELILDDRGRPLRHFFDPKAAMAKEAAVAGDARRTRNDPWAVFGSGTAVGPLYPGGADPADLADRQKRIGEILSDRKSRMDAKRVRREQLRNADIPGLPKEPGAN